MMLLERIKLIGSFVSYRCYAHVDFKRGKVSSWFLKGKFRLPFPCMKKQIFYLYLNRKICFTYFATWL